MRFLRVTLSVLGFVCFAGLFAGRGAAADSPARPDGPAAPAVPLTRIADVKKWAELADQALAVELEGVVTHVAAGGSFFLHDGEMGIHVGQSERGQHLQPGARVRVVGATRRGAFAPSIEPRELLPLGPGVWPEPRRASYDEVASGTLDGQWLEIAGVVCDASSPPATPGTVLNLAVEGRRLRVTVNHTETIDPDVFIDAEVRLRGVASGSFNRQRQLVEPVLRVPGWSCLSVIRPPPSEPYAVPVVPLAQLLGFSLEAPSPHRVRIQGVVTRSISDRVLFMREGRLGIKVETCGPAGFNPGDEIEAVGFPAMARGSAVMENALTRLLRTGTAPVPVRAAWAELLDGTHSADLVTVRARLVDWITAGESVTLVLQAEDQLFQAILPGVPPGGAMPENNSIVEATGICALSALDDRRQVSPRAFVLLLSSRTDLAVVERPDWWTAERLWRALAVVLALLVIGLGWVWALRRQVQRKRAIIAQQSHHAAVLEERSRIARDLHDTLEQGLTALSLQLKVVELDHKEAPHQVGEGLEAARQMLRQSRALAHDAIRELRTDDLARRHEPLAAGLQRIVSTWKHSGIPGVALVIEGPECPLPGETERHLAAIAAEAITNAVKHGRATAIHVCLCYGTDGVQLRIQDNGTGFDSAGGAPAGAGGLGLVGMRERAAAIGGKLDIQGNSGAGTCIVVEVAYDRATARDGGPAASASTASTP